MDCTLSTINVREYTVCVVCLVSFASVYLCVSFRHSLVFSRRVIENHFLSPSRVSRVLFTNVMALCADDESIRVDAAIIILVSARALLFAMVTAPVCI